MRRYLYIIQRLARLQSFAFHAAVTSASHPTISYGKRSSILTKIKAYAIMRTEFVNRSNTDSRLDLHPPTTWPLKKARKDGNNGIRHPRRQPGRRRRPRREGHRPRPQVRGRPPGGWLRHRLRPPGPGPGGGTRRRQLRRRRRGRLPRPVPRG